MSNEVASHPARPRGKSSACSGPVALVCTEPVRECMAGIGIRYFEMAARLPGLGVPTRLVSPFVSEDERVAIQNRLPDGATTAALRDGDIAPHLEGARAVVVQGQLANDVIHAGASMPLVVDLYDPWLVENLHYLESLGLDPYRNDHASWMLQLSAGDLFLCSSPEQRLFYAGLLTALGRVNPIAMREDPQLDDLLRVVPFGIPDELPQHRPYLDPGRGDEFRILFGGLYEWYDPWPVLDALRDAARSGKTHWRLLFVHNPNAGTPQQLVGEVRRWVAHNDLDEQVRFLDWVPADRRYDLLRDVDATAATHRDSLETRLSMRTRFLDALAVRCPIVVTEGGTVSRLLVERDAGWVVPEADAHAVRTALEAIEGSSGEVSARLDAGVRLAEDFAWDRVLAPLRDYLLDPWRDETKSAFAARLPTHAPADDLGFRLRRKVRRWLGAPA